MDRSKQIEALAKARWDRQQGHKSVFEKYIMKFPTITWNELATAVQDQYIKQAESELMFLERDGFTVKELSGQ